MDPVEAAMAVVTLMTLGCYIAIEPFGKKLSKKLEKWEKPSLKPKKNNIYKIM